MGVCIIFCRHYTTPCSLRQWKPIGDRLEYSYCTVLSSALCYCTAELLSSRCRHASVRPSFVDIVFSDTTEWINAKFWGQVPIHHISRPFFPQNYIYIYFYFLRFFFVFVNIRPYGRKKLKRHLRRKYTSHSLQKIMHTSRKGLYQSCSRNCEFQSGFLPFFFFFINMGPYGAKNFKRYLL